MRSLRGRVPIFNTPMQEIIAALKFIADIFKEPYKAVMAILVISALALFLPTSVTQRAGIDAALKSHLLLEWGLFSFATVYLVIFLVGIGVKRIQLLRHFRDLPIDERVVVNAFMHAPRRTANLIANAPTASAMARMGILEEGGPLPNEKNFRMQRGECFYSIKPWAFRFLRKHPNLYH